MKNRDKGEKMNGLMAEDLQISRLNRRDFLAKRDSSDGEEEIQSARKISGEKPAVMSKRGEISVLASAKMS